MKNILLTIIFMVVVTTGIYFILINKQNEKYLNPLESSSSSSSSFSSKPLSSSPPLHSSSSALPIITSVSPNSGPVGTEITLLGSGFKKVTPIYYPVMYFGQALLRVDSGWAQFNFISDNEIKYKIPPVVCVSGGHESGSCLQEEKILPRIYEIYLENNLGRSNKVKFTVTSTSSIPLTLVWPNGGEKLYNNSENTLHRSYRIKWSAPNLTKISGHQNLKWRVDWFRANGDTDLVTILPVNQYEYLWIVPTSLVRGSDYKIRISLVKDCLQSQYPCPNPIQTLNPFFNESDGLFDITEGTYGLFPHQFLKA